MKKYFVTGIIILLPIALTIVIAVWLFDLLTDPFVGIVEKIIMSFEARSGIDLRHHETLVLIFSRIIVAIFLFILVFVLGFFGRMFFMHEIIKWSQILFKKIPFIKTIYTISHDVTKSIFTEGKTTFQKTVLIPFPRQDTRTLGLVTGEPPPALKKAIASSDLDVVVFVPTSPHPVSGYVVITSHKELVDVEMSTEDTFRYLISCGLALPKEDEKKKV